MKRLIEYFDRAYVINLRDRPDRLAGAVLEFANIGLTFPCDQVRLHYGTRPTEKGNFDSLGRKGCFYAHRSVLIEAERDRLRNVLVFEDDVLFTHSSTADIDRLISAISTIEWDIIRFGWHAHLTSPDPNGSLLADPPRTVGTHFYAINSPFISEMRQYMDECEARPVGHPKGGPMGADGAYNHVRIVRPNLRVYLAVPNLAEQRSSRSDIDDQKLIDRFRFLRPAAEFARSVKTLIRRSRFR